MNIAETSATEQERVPMHGFDLPSPVVATEPRMIATGISVSAKRALQLEAAIDDIEWDAHPGTQAGKHYWLRSGARDAFYGQQIRSFPESEASQVEYMKGYNAAKAMLADGICPRCGDTGEVMVRAKYPMSREDTRGYEEVACPECSAA